MLSELAIADIRQPVYCLALPCLALMRGGDLDVGNAKLLASLAALIAYHPGLLFFLYFPPFCLA